MDATKEICAFSCGGGGSSAVAGLFGGEVGRRRRLIIQAHFDFPLSFRRATQLLRSGSKNYSCPHPGRSPLSPPRPPQPHFQCRRRLRDGGPPRPSPPGSCVCRTASVSDGKRPLLEGKGKGGGGDRVKVTSLFLPGGRNGLGGRGGGRRREVERRETPLL